MGGKESVKCYNLVFCYSFPSCRFLDDGMFCLISQNTIHVSPAIFMWIMTSFFQASPCFLQDVCDLSCPTSAFFLYL